MLWDRCPVCLSVTLVYCGQTVGWIKMSRGTEVGLGRGHIVLDGNPTPPTERGTAALSPLFGPCLLWPNGWMDQDTTWYGGRLGLGPGDSVLDGDLGPRGKGHCSPHFLAHVYCGQTVAHLRTAELLFYLRVKCFGSFLLQEASVWPMLVTPTRRARLVLRWMTVQE